MVLQLVYGNSRKPPGDEKSPSRKLMVVLEADDKEKEEEKGERDKEENEKEEEPNEIDNKMEEKEEDVLIGIWAPPNNLAKAMVLKYLFPNISGPFVGPEIELPPFYVAVAYDAFKARDVMELSEKYPGQVLSYGFFTSDIPAETQLIVKTIDKFEERKTQTT